MKLSALWALAGLMTLTINANAHNNAHSHASKPEHNLIGFSTNATQKVENDEVHATMSKSIWHKSSAEVAKRITETLNQAMMIAKKYPSVTVNTGSQSTYPEYDKNQKISGWTGRATLQLKSSDTVAVSQLIADLQNFMQLSGLDFSVSESKQKAITQTLMIDASKAFQQQAKNLLPVWNATDYQLVSLDFTQGSGHNYASYSKELAMPVATDVSIPTQNFAVGESTISVTANGVIQLVK
ncbi:hypothetical protein MOMA_07851 [Moraxella macacae 0408225]|uniref:Periplasmic/secreted protein n=1 Tax=Moraxella macacae 0408225 TaxID=1230338 RepID=L2F7L8_9GAMM|nr:SIMPL domain-containing protein [Moraxella macacae]ELA08458.1 hypothetical protein MOMA_07851 [Moraxella macacae 0408225]